MAIITKGLNESNMIYLSVGGSRQIVAEYIKYIWEPVGGGNSEAINGALTEDWYASRLCIEVKIKPFREESVATHVTTDWLLNTFLPSKTKRFKEVGWLDYIDVVLDMDRVEIENWRIREYADLTLKFKKKTVGIIATDFEDGFEDGDFAKWDAVGSDWSVQDSVVISGDYSAQCDVTEWESEEAKLEKSGAWQNFIFEADIRVSQKYGVCQKATIGGRSDGTGWIYYGLSMRPGDGGHFQYFDGTAFYNFPNDKTWAVDTVYHVKITYDFTNSIQYTWVDGFYLGQRSMKDGHGVLLNGNRYFEKVSIFGSSGWESGHDYLYVDNIKIYKY